MRTEKTNTIAYYYNSSECNSVLTYGYSLFVVIQKKSSIVLFTCATLHNDCISRKITDEKHIKNVI